MNQSTADPLPNRGTSLLSFQLQALSSRINAVNEIAAALNHSLNLEDILKVIKQQAKWLLDFQHCSICLCNADGTQQTHLLFDTIGVESQNHPQQAQLLALAIATKQPQLVQGQAWTASASPYHSWLAMPIESDERIWGAILFGDTHPQQYTQEDLRIAHLVAIQLANAIRNAHRFAEISRLYAELQQAYTDLRRSEQLRDDMMRMIVHDLRNPLNVINMSLAVIESAEIADVHSIIERAKRASRNMFTLINNLLDLGKLESNELNLQLGLIDGNSLLTSLFDDWRERAVAEQKTMRLQLTTPLPSFYADLPLLRRVLDNLLSNAFKYTARPALIEIGAKVVEDCLALSVRDNGIGIPPHYHERIFDKFVQVIDAGKLVHQGFGLGLAFCKLVVQAHGGRIWIESVVQQGTTVTFTLPLTRQPIDD